VNSVVLSEENEKREIGIFQPTLPENYFAAKTEIGEIILFLPAKLLIMEEN